MLLQIYPFILGPFIGECPRLPTLELYPTRDTTMSSLLDDGKWKLGENVNNFSLFEHTAHFHAKFEQYFFVEGTPFIHSQIAN
jgi:hypothetical protein